MSFTLAMDPSWEPFHARHWLSTEMKKTWSLPLASAQEEGQTSQINERRAPTKSKALRVSHSNTKRDVCTTPPRNHHILSIQDGDNIHSVTD